ncbi:response regulator [Imperialibacter roseus]|uniref:Response regulator n=1 Tax=Imperialibacter roseus TaxID=1324217 RepID=A0ABZ0IX60_9BACT|nr:response regulator [Imperialibacter roseus]WOK09376.1 response regulator [Imperialibacter roseus]
MTKDNIVEILLVEDNKHDAELAILALKEAKLFNNVVWLKDGKEALDFLFGDGQFKGRDINHHPKVILLDLKMPKVDGLEVLREIRAHKNTRKIPVVILTSSREDQDIVISYELGVNSFIVKPVDFDQFTRCVKEIGYYWALINQYSG